MSIISTIQSEVCYNFSIEKATQSLENKLLIEQSSNRGLRVYLQKNGRIHQVNNHLIEGLPKIDLIPREFFDSCTVRFVKFDFCDEGKVYFTHPLLGGGKIPVFDEIGRACLSLGDAIEGNPERARERWANWTNDSVIATGGQTVGLTVAAGATAMVGQTNISETLISNAGRSGQQFLSNTNQATSPIYLVNEGRINELRNHIIPNLQTEAKSDVSRVDREQQDLCKIINQAESYCQDIKKESEKFSKIKDYNGVIDFSKLDNKLNTLFLEKSNLFIGNIEERIQLVKSERSNLCDKKLEFCSIRNELISNKKNLEYTISNGEAKEKDVASARARATRSVESLKARIAELETLEKMSHSGGVIGVLTLIPEVMEFIKEKNDFNTNINVPECIKESKVWIQKSQEMIDKTKEILDNLEKKELELVNLTKHLENLRDNLNTNKCVLIIRNISSIGLENLKKILINGGQLELIASGQPILDF